MKILIADDDPLTLEAMSVCLVEEGFEVFPAANGDEALNIWSNNPPHLLCLDIMMPQINGYEVCRQIRTKDTTVPILFLSAKNQEIDVVAGLSLGADDFIRKPFTRAEVVARIRAALRRAYPECSRGRSIAMANLRVFPDALMAERNGQPIELTQREASILELLHRHTGLPVTRDRFLDVCWGLDYFPDSRTLDQHILILRKKIESDPSYPKIIETVRGIGYRYPGVVS